MSEVPKAYAVRNFRKYQVHTDRTPKWLKWWLSTMDNPDFRALPDAAKYHCVAMLMLAGVHENVIPADAEYVKFRVGLTSKPDFDALQRAGFIEVVNFCTISDEPVQFFTQDREREGEGEKEGEPYPSSTAKKRPSPTRWMTGFDYFWNGNGGDYPGYPRKVNKQAARKAYAKHMPKDPALFRAQLRAIVWRAHEMIHGEWADREPDKIPHPSTFLNAEEFPITPATLEEDNGA